MLDGPVVIGISNIVLLDQRFLQVKKLLVAISTASSQSEIKSCDKFAVINTD